MGTVTLADGLQVDSNSREWLLECEAAYVLAMPTLAERRQFLDGVATKRGQSGRQALEARVRALWEMRRKK